MPDNADPKEMKKKVEEMMKLHKQSEKQMADLMKMAQGNAEMSKSMKEMEKIMKIHSDTMKKVVNNMKG